MLMMEQLSSLEGGTLGTLIGTSIHWSFPPGSMPFLSTLVRISFSLFTSLPFLKTTVWNWGKCFEAQVITIGKIMVLTLTNSADDPANDDELWLSISAEMRIFSPGMKPLLGILTFADIGPLLHHKQQRNFESSFSIGS